MKVDRDVMESSLRSKGFAEDRRRDHIYFHHHYRGKKTGAYTKVSHTAKMKEVSGDLLTQVRKQLRLDSTKEAVDLLTCPMDAEEYNSLLIGKGVFRLDS